MAVRSTELAEKVEISALRRGLFPVATLEIPATPKDQWKGCAWDLPEVDKWTMNTDHEKAMFNMCVYGPPLYKPEEWRGACTGLLSSNSQNRKR